MAAATAERVIRPSLLAQQIDELGALERELTPMKSKIARAEMLRKAIRSFFDSHAAGKSFETTTPHFVAIVGACKENRSIDFAALAKAIGLKEYARLATVTLGDLEASVPCAIAAAVVTSGATGPRSLRIFERGQA